MSSSHSDALVFYGATGDLAFKKIFPALQAMVRRGHLDVPVVGVARSPWTIDQFRQRVRDSLEKHGGVIPWHLKSSLDYCAMSLSTIPILRLAVRFTTN